MLLASRTDTSSSVSAVISAFHLFPQASGLKAYRILNRNELDMKLIAWEQIPAPLLSRNAASQPPHLKRGSEKEIFII